MSAFDRMLLFVYTFTITALLAFFCIMKISIFLGLEHLFLNLNNDFYVLRSSTSIIWLVVLLLMLAGIRLLFVSISSRKNIHGVVQEHVLGQVHITSKTLEELVKRAVYKIDGVRKVVPRIYSDLDGIEINVRISIVPDTKIQVVSEKIQQQIKDYITEFAGLNVRNVKVVIENVISSSARVE
ncbi:alkaline shock response membrane anchor protein AmaP [Peptococcaceae bacterium]|nr:alkaline shock response membrane anchor protein AmaP [Peptococcaceae bacterium]